MFNQRIKDDQRIADSLAERVCASFAALNAAEMLKYAAETCQDEDSRVLILDSLGVVQVDTDSQLNGVRLYLAESSKVLSGAASGYGIYDASGRDTKHTSATVSIFSAGSDMKGVFASAIADENGLLGVAIYISRVQEIYDSLREIQLKILGWLVVVALIVIVMSSLVLRTITKPVGELREGIAKMSGGDFSARVNVRGKTEFAELAAAFNGMSEKLETLDRSRNLFVSNASHELKTPLSTMKILIETILYQDPIDPGMAREFLSDVNKEIDRLNRIVSDLLTLVNIDSGGMKLSISDIDLHELLLEQVKRLAPLARENGIELECSAKEALETPGDAVKLQQVIYNVIDNAIKYTPRGGSVQASLARSGKRAIIRVTDTGIGIPAADLPHVFDRFYRVDKARSRATGGTGLGLSIVKQIVMLHGGTITATSEEGKGSTFTIDLPLSQK
ncbi:MAG: HAMP domain-containing sensor histidine kinase [Candidatus Faecivicinus sp.]|nr:HAMP domain-containing sensor histidine kinase [Candidatus Faecivicinus sp.]